MIMRGICVSELMLRWMMSGYAEEPQGRHSESLIVGGETEVSVSLVKMKTNMMMMASDLL